MRKLEDYVLRDNEVRNFEKEMLVLLEEIIYQYDDFYFSNVDYKNMIHFGYMYIFKKIWAAGSSLGCSIGSYFACLEICDNDFKTLPFVLETLFVGFLGYVFLNHINNDEVLKVSPDFIIEKKNDADKRYGTLVDEFFSKYVNYVSKGCTNFDSVSKQFDYLFVKHKDFIDKKINDGDFSKDFNMDILRDIYFTCGFYDLDDIISLAFYENDKKVRKRLYK